MNCVKKFVVPSLAVMAAVAAFWAQSAAATTITYLGVDSSTQDAWHTSSVVKSETFDVQKDNVYGTDGYLVGYSDKTDYDGIMLTKSSKPEFLTASGIDSNGVTALRSFWAANVYAKIDNPSYTDGTDFGSTGLWHNDSDNTKTNFFQFTLSRNADFVLGVIVGTHDSQAYNSPTVTLSCGTTSTTSDTITYPTSFARYVFFHVTGSVNDTFTVSMSNASVAATSSGLTFDAVPEPSSTAILVSGIAGLLAYAWRKRR